MKYAFLVPIYNHISGRLFKRFLNLQEWCPQLDGKIYTVVGRTHADARNWLCTDGGGFSNSRKLIDKVDYLVWIDADQQFNYQQLITLLEYDSQFCAGWYVKDLSNVAMIADWEEEYFKKKKDMSDSDIEEFLRTNSVEFDNGFIRHGYHRACAMIGRLIRGEKYFPFYMLKVNIYSKPRRKDGIHRIYSPVSKLKNIFFMFST